MKIFKEIEHLRFKFDSISKMHFNKKIKDLNVKLYEN